MNEKNQFGYDKGLFNLYIGGLIGGWVWIWLFVCNDSLPLGWQSVNNLFAAFLASLFISPFTWFFVAVVANILAWLKGLLKNWLKKRKSS